jgi:hypothetical protein
MTDQPTVSVFADGNWVTVPVAGESPEDYGLAVVAELGDDVPEGARELLAAELTGCAARAQGSEAIFASVMLAADLDRVLAYTECTAFATTNVPATVEQLIDELSAEPIDPPGWREITRADLPAGPAARVHVLDAEPSDAATAPASGTRSPPACRSWRSRRRTPGPRRPTSGA